MAKGSETRRPETPELVTFPTSVPPSPTTTGPTSRRHPADGGGAPSVEQEVAELRASLRFVEGRVDSMRGGTDIAKILLLFWGGVTIVLGVFGFQTISDLSDQTEDMVVSKYQEYGRSSSGVFIDFKDLLEKTKKLNTDFEQVHHKYLDRIDGLLVTHLATDDFDLEGQLQRLMLEATAREQTEPTIDAQKVDYSGTTLEEAWRTRVLAALMVLNRTIESGTTSDSSAMDPNLVFNAAQMARGLDAYHLAAQLATAANKMLPTAIHKALAHNVRIKSLGDMQQRDAEFEGLMDMVAELSGNPHIIVAEAWNAAEVLRRYARLIEAIEQLEAKSRAAAGVGDDQPAPIVSYVYVIKAQAILRESMPGCVERARAAMAFAEELFSQESAHSVWYESTMREAIMTKTILAKSETMSFPDPLEISDLLQLLASDSEPLGDLEQLLDSLPITELSSADSPAGRIVVGARVRFARPEDPMRGRGWIDEMDVLAIDSMTVRRIRQLGENIGIEVVENDMIWSPDWALRVDP